MGCTQFFLAQKGADAVRGLSMLLSSFLVQFGIIVMLANVIRRDVPGGGPMEKIRLERYDIFMCSLSAFALLILFLLGYTGKLTKVHRKIRHKSFIRGGMLLLGSGGVVYHGARIIDFSMTEVDCRGSVQSFVVVVMELVFILMTMAFIFMWCEMDIVNNIWMAMFCRMLLTQIIATSTLVLSSAIMEEALEQIHELEEARATSGEHDDYDMTHDDDSHIYVSDMFDSTIWNNSLIDSLEETMYGALHDLTTTHSSEEAHTEPERDSDHEGHCETDTLAGTVASFTFPLLVEYGVVSLTILVMLWDEIRPIDQSDRRDEDDDNREDHVVDAGRARHRGTESARSGPSCSQSCVMHHYGVILGWVLVLIVFIMCLNYFRQILITPDDPSVIIVIRTAIYGQSLAISSLAIIVIPIAGLLLGPLTFRDNHIKCLKREHEGGPMYKHGGRFGKALDKGLLLITTFALVSFKLLSCMSVVDKTGLDAYIILADSAMCIIMAYMQTLFINYYASRKVAKTVSQQQEKPGNRGMYFLRCVNFCLWLINTFLLKHPRAKVMQVDYYGMSAWPLLTNVLQPLSILFYFHSFVFLSDISVEIYQDDYVGIRRKDKQKDQRGRLPSGPINNEQDGKHHVKDENTEVLGRF